ncbi:MAG: DUF721 domain-containing protein [Thermaerobacter sp.]|nr:DUF721 domain-containing protein [Thermaerobacter sp.]
MARQPASIELRAILNQMVRDYPWQPARLLHNIQIFWAEVVGQPVANHSRILGYQQGRLMLAVSSPVWAQELTYLKPAILQALRQRLPAGMEIPQEITVRVSLRAFRDAEASPVRQERAVRAVRAHAQETRLPVLLDNVRLQYIEASRVWLQSAYHRCARCQSPTLRTYLLCAICGLDYRPR